MTGPTTRRPRLAMIDPNPFMKPVTVIRSDLPPIEACSARSTATAVVMILIGPPIRHPMTPNATNSTDEGNADITSRWAKIARNGSSIAVNMTITQALLPPKMSDIYPTNIPPYEREN
jgi:hypothetical protein